MLRKFAVLFLLLLAAVSPATAETQSPDPPHMSTCRWSGAISTPANPRCSSPRCTTTPTSPVSRTRRFRSTTHSQPASLAGWQVTTGTRTVTFPQRITLTAHAKLWCARKAVDFRPTFGVEPGCEYGGDSDPAVPDLTGSALHFTNTGGRVTLLAPERQLLRRAGLRRRRCQRAGVAGAGGLPVQAVDQLRRRRTDPLPQAGPAHRPARARHRHARRLGVGARRPDQRAQGAVSGLGAGTLLRAAGRHRDRHAGRLPRARQRLCHAARRCWPGRDAASASRGTPSRMRAWAR